MNMTSTNCLNCGALLAYTDKFCAACGQKTNTHRLTIKHLLHEFFHAVTHADKGIINLIRQLATQPYKVATEYVEGKRKKYFNPMTFFLLCIGFFIFMNNIIKPYGEPAKPDPKILAQLPSEASRQMYITAITRSTNATTFLAKNTNNLAMVAVPFYAFLIWLFFKKRGRNFSEIMLAVILFTAFSNLLFTIFFTPVMGYYFGTAKYFYVFLIGVLLMIAYYSWGFKTFFNYTSFIGYIKIFSVMFFVMLVWTLVTFTAIFYYVYRDKSGRVIAALWDKVIS